MALARSQSFLKRYPQGATSPEEAKEVLDLVETAIEALVAPGPASINWSADYRLPPLIKGEA